MYTSFSGSTVSRGKRVYRQHKIHRKMERMVGSAAPDMGNSISAKKTKKYNSAKIQAQIENVDSPTKYRPHKMTYAGKIIEENLNANRMEPEASYASEPANSQAQGNYGSAYYSSISSLMSQYFEADQGILSDSCEDLILLLGIKHGIIDELNTAVSRLGLKNSLKLTKNLLILNAVSRNPPLKKRVKLLYSKIKRSLNKKLTALGLEFHTILDEVAQMVKQFEEKQN